MMRARTLLSVGLSACGAASAPAPVIESSPVPPAAAPPRCRDRQVWRGNGGEGVQLAADDRHLYWQAYNFGEVWRAERTGDAPAFKVVQGSEDEMNVQAWVVEDGHARWGSKAQQAIYEARLDGGATAARQVYALGLTPFDVAVVDGIVYAAGFDGALGWWSPTGGSGSRVIADAEEQLAAGPDGLYVATGRGVVRLRDQAATPESVAFADVMGLQFHALAIMGRRLWAQLEIAGDATLASVDLDSGETWYAQLPEVSLNVAPHPSGDGAVFDVAESVYWIDAADQVGEAVLLATYPGEYVTDLLISGDSLFVATSVEDDWTIIVRERCLARP